ncbi:MAG: PorT family protein [Bacteroidetes bacterium]|nr:MAG: PorT family protein [Bacteroidota bacterium]
MKKNFLLLGMLLVGAALSAQISIKAGLNFANMVFEEKDENIEDLVDDGGPKLMAGVAFILPLGKQHLLALQPEVMYIRKGSQSMYTILNETYSNDLTYDYIDVPLLLRFSLGDSYGEGLGIYLNAGVYGGYALGGRTTLETPLGTVKETLTFDAADDQRRIDFGFVGGAGLALGNIFLEVRYLHGTNNLLDDDADNTNNGDFSKLQHRGVGLTAGITF